MITVHVQINALLTVSNVISKETTLAKIHKQSVFVTKMIKNYIKYNLYDYISGRTCHIRFKFVLTIIFVSWMIVSDSNVNGPRVGARAARDESRLNVLILKWSGFNNIAYFPVFSRWHPWWLTDPSFCVCRLLKPFFWRLLKLWQYLFIIKNQRVK